MPVRNKPVKVRLTEQDFKTLDVFAERELSTPGGLASRIVSTWCFERRAGASLSPVRPVPCEEQGQG